MSEEQTIAGPELDARVCKAAGIPPASVEYGIETDGDEPGTKDVSWFPGYSPECMREVLKFWLTHNGGTPSSKLVSREHWLPVSTDPAAALSALNAVAGMKHRSWTLYTPDGTAAEPPMYCEIRSGNHKIIAEGWAGVITREEPEPTQEEEDSEWNNRVPLAICRSILALAASEYPVVPPRRTANVTSSPGA